MYRRLVMIAAATLPLAAPAAAAEPHDFQQAVPADARGIVEVSNVSGTVKVMGWEQPQVSVTGELGSGVERVDVTHQPGRTVVKVILPPHLLMRSGDAELTVKVPKDSEVHVSAVSADISTTGVLGVQRLNSVSGDIQAELADKDADLKSVSGDMILKGHGPSARWHVSSISGDIRLTGAGGEIEGGTTSGNLVAGLQNARSVRVRTTAGDLKFTGTLARGANLDLASISGAVTLHAAAPGGYRYELSTFSGDLHNCLRAAGDTGEAVGHSQQGTFGEGAGSLRVKTLSGDVTVCDH
ncbi:MAG: DUF4097 family beta strand repeat protein [Proteobacteria bacterium]|nr:DUF4097 family beta strand repeat protein [Pseudomonadota bacterium]